MKIENNTSLSLGSIVRLRSGGPQMTVCWIYSNETDKPLDKDIPNNEFIKAMWFTQAGVLEEAKFHVKTLTE